MSTNESPRDPAHPSRIVLGGFLMGMANLVPGVSGGTMILAVGLYDRFIEAVADVTRLQFRRDTLVFCGLLALGLLTAIIALAGPAVWLVTEHRWLAYSLFVGMTLGGVPLLVQVAQPMGPGEWLAAGAGFAGMALFAFGLSDGALPQTFAVLLLVGAAASASMILPGISGSYVLLICGLYDVVVGSLRPASLAEDWQTSLKILLPVLLGVGLGIGLLSNLLKWILARHERVSHAALLGLLVGSVLGLYPFQRASHPEVASKAGIEAVLLVLAGEEAEVIEERTGVALDGAQLAVLGERYAGASKGDLKLAGLELEPYGPGIRRVLLALVAGVMGFLATRCLGRAQPQT